MNRYYEASYEGHMLPMIYPTNPSFRTLIGQQETLAELIDRHIEKFPPDRTSFRATVTTQKDLATVAVGLKVQDKDGKGSWAVMVGAHFPKQGSPAATFELIREL